MQYNFKEVSIGTYTKLYQTQVQYTKQLISVKWEWNKEQNGMEWNGMVIEAGMHSHMYKSAANSEREPLLL